MKKLLKWILIIGGGLFLILILCLIMIPLFVDMNKYKAPLEEKISASIGREFSIKGDLELSLFPWAGVSFTDLYLGNPEGFKEKEFVRIKGLEARVKLLPLISKNIHARFVLDGAHISYITLKSGRTNVDGLTPSETPAKEEAPKTEKPSGEKSELPIKSIEVEEFSITNGAILVVDERQNTRNEIKDITLKLKNVSFDNPIELQFAATVDEKRLAAEGQIGPLGSPIGKNDVPMDFKFTALDQIKTQIKGTLSQLDKEPNFNLAIETKPFSLKKVLTALGQKDVLNPSDSSVLEKISFQTKINGDAKAVAMSDGIFVIDDSKITFSGSAKEFDKPNLTFTAHLNQMDLDRYLPETAPEDAGATQPATATQKTASSSEKPDYTPLRSLVLKVKLTADAIKASNIKIQDLVVNITGNKGVFNLNPLSFNMYDGSVKANAQANFKTDTPATSFQLDADNINSNPLVMDFMEKDIIEGALKAAINLSMKGTDPAEIKRTLNGTGELLFKNGAVKGVDLTSMSRNIQTAFGVGTGEASEARTDFAEFVCPFDIVNGVVNTSGTRLASPLLRLNATGKANLNSEKLDFRIEPKFVATIAGQGDASERSGFKVPVLVTGTFSSPKFAPDVGSVVQDTLKEKLQEKTGLKNLFQGDASSESEDASESEKLIEDATKGLLKKLPFGR